jgi:hypothetical protein
LMGDFGKRLFEPSDLFGEFPLAAHQAEQRRKQAVGVAFSLVSFFWLIKRKKLACRAKATCYNLRKGVQIYICTP